jgi:hypothetical protein
MLKTIRLKCSFPARDGQGRTRSLDVFVEVQDARTHGKPKAEVEGLSILKTREGQHVNRLEKGKYQIVETGEILTSDDPLAA